MDHINKDARIVNEVTLADTSKLIITRPTEADASEIINFLNKVGGETDFLTFGLNEFQISLSEEKQIISDCLKVDFCLMLIGRIHNEIVSQLYVSRTNKPRLQHIGDLSISVSKKHWGKAIGKYMILSAIEWAKHKKLAKLQLQVRSDNERAIALYQKLGFVIEGTLSRALKINNVFSGLKAGVF